MLVAISVVCAEGNIFISQIFVASYLYHKALPFNIENLGNPHCRLPQQCDSVIIINYSFSLLFLGATTDRSNSAHFAPTFC